MRPGREVDPSPPSSVAVKNEWSYTSAPSVCLLSMDRDNFYIYLHILRRHTGARGVVGYGTVGTGTSVLEELCFSLLS
jgi:hypothetical protein